MKHWTEQDAERALDWIKNKQAGTAVWIDTGGADQRLRRLERLIDDDLAEFVTELQSMLKPSAWKRMLGTLRQHAHKARPKPDESLQDIVQDDVPATAEERIRVLVKAVQGISVCDFDYITARDQDWLAGELEYLAERLKHHHHHQDDQDVDHQDDQDVDHQDDQVLDRDHRILQLHRSGKTQTQIAAEIGISRRTVGRIIKQNEAA